MNFFFSFSDQKETEEICKMFKDADKHWMAETYKRLEPICQGVDCTGKNLEVSVKKISECEENYELFLVLMLTFYPNNFFFEDVFIEDICSGLLEEKVNVAIETNLASGMPYEEIKKRLGIKEEAFGESSVPAIIRSKDLEIQSLRNINQVRTFFAKYPYASIAEAAKTLKLKNKEIRKIINDLESEGEVVKYSNVLRTTEYEAIKKQIIEIKMEDPMLSDQELAYQLQLPINIVRAAVQEAVRIMKMENAQNFAFMAHQSANVFKTIEEEAYKRHKATQNSSSEWLKIMVSARTAIVELYGLKEPEKIDVLHEFQHSSKEEKQALLDAYFATDVIDVDCKQIEMKTEEGKEDFDD
jgi:hypothetical protein